MKNKIYRIHRRGPLNFSEWVILKSILQDLSPRMTLKEGYDATRGLIYLCSLFLEQWNEGTHEWERLTEEMLCLASPEDYGNAVGLVLKHLNTTLTDSELQTSTGFKFKF